MALTVTEVKKTALKDLYLHIYKVDWDASYVTNGLALTAADLGFADQASLLTVLPQQKLGYTAEYDPANAKLKAYWGDYNNAADAPAKEVDNGTNMATVVDMIVLALGTKPA
jgi:hypothetical protein